MLTQSRCRRAFTLVELLVVIAIIAILVSLLSPAVNSAREAARLTQCKNNLKNIGLALLNHEAATKELPAALAFPDSVTDRQLPISFKYLANWVINILPYMEEQSLYDSFVWEDESGAELYVSSPANREPRGATMSVMICRSDPNTAIPFVGHNSTEGDNWARGNYAANGYNQSTDRPVGLVRIENSENCAKADTMRAGLFYNLRVVFAG